MSALDDVRKAIETKVETEWNKTLFPLARENLPFDSPTASAWARLSIRPAGDENTAVGSGLEGQERITGFVWFQIFVPVNKGVAPAFAFRDYIKGLFANKTLNVSLTEPIYFRTAELNYVGIDSASGDNQWRCLVQFHVDLTD